MIINITPKTSNGEIGLSEYIRDNQELTELVKGIGFIRNIRKINIILKKWHINYAQYSSTRKIVEKYSSQDGNLNPVVLTVSLFNGQCDKTSQDKYIRDLLKVLDKCYSLKESDLTITFVED